MTKPGVTAARKPKADVNYIYVPLPDGGVRAIDVNARRSAGRPTGCVICCGLLLLFTAALLFGMTSRHVFDARSCMRWWRAEELQHATTVHHGDEFSHRHHQGWCRHCNLLFMYVLTVLRRHKRCKYDAGFAMI